MAAALKDLLDRFEAMRLERSPFEQHWQEIRDYQNAEGPDFTTQRQAGSKRRDLVLDNTAEEAAKIMWSGLYGMTTSPAKQWFDFRARSERLNKIDAVARANQVNAKIQSAHYSSPISRFHVAQPGMMKDYVLYGMGGKFIAEVPRAGAVHMYRPLRELFVAENDLGVIDTCYRHYRLTPYQALRKFGHQLGPKVKAAFNDPKRAAERFEFVHATEPRLRRDPQRADNGNMAWQSCHVCLDDKLLIKESGFPEFPWNFARWTAGDGSAYPRGPGMSALPDTKMLQRMMRATIIGAEKTINPSLLVPDDGVLGPVRMDSGGMTVVRADLFGRRGDPIRPLQTGARPDLGEELMEPVRDRIRRAYFNQLMRMFEDPRMTATQVLQEVEEQLRILGPYMGILETETFGPDVDRTFAILDRADVFEPWPDDVADAELATVYHSPIARAQRLSDARGISATFDMVAPIVPLNPEVIDNIDTDDLFRHGARMFNFPATSIRDVDSVKKIRAARNQQAAAEAQKADASMAADAGGKLIKALGAQGAPASSPAPAGVAA